MTQRTDAHMRSTDAFSWYMERDPELRSTIVTIAWLDRAPDWKQLVERSDRASRIIPHFRDKVLEPPLRLATPRWTSDEDFDLSWHLRRVRVPRGGGDGSVLELARREAVAAFDPAHPLWHTTLIEGLPHGRAAVMWKLHHALTDGVGGMQLATLVFDLEPTAPDLGDMPAAPEAEHIEGTPALLGDALATRLDQARRFLHHEVVTALPSLAGVARHPAAAVTRAIATAGSVWRTVAPVSTTLSPIMTERHLARALTTIDIPVDGLRAAGKAAGGTLNDAFLAAVSGGLRRYHEEHGTIVGDLRVTLPVNIRKADDPIGGNRITLQRCLVPAGITDPIARMQRIHERIQQVRAEPSLDLTNEIAAGLNLLPPSYVGGILKHVDFLASNVPGPPAPVYLAGARMTGYYAFGPTIGSSVNLTLISYCGTCNIGINIDAGAVRDPEVLMSSLRAGFDEVIAVGAPSTT